MKTLSCAGNFRSHKPVAVCCWVLFVQAILVFAATGLSCKDEGSRKDVSLAGAQQCVLPFPIGNAYPCFQGFNGRYGHSGVFAYSVDFTMQIGTTITAVRGGRVRYVQESYLDTDGTPGHENVVIIDQGDSTYARYAHLTAGGALVTAGQVVEQGDTIALSGASGQSVIPHLHFDVTKGSYDRWNAQTIPFVFMNASPSHQELQAGVVYRAMPY